MSESKNYPKDFVQRTIKLLKEVTEDAKKKDLEITLLLNCLLGMIVCVIENISKFQENKDINFNHSYFKIKLNDSDIKNIIPRKIKVLDIKVLKKSILNEINNKEFLKNFSEEYINLNESKIPFLKHDEVLNYEFLWLVKKIRNGIAHQHLHPTNSNGNWKGVRIWNINNEGYKDFAIEFNLKQLKDFSIEIAQRYLKSLSET